MLIPFGDFIDINCIFRVFLDERIHDLNGKIIELKLNTNEHNNYLTKGPNSYK